MAKKNFSDDFSAFRADDNLNQSEEKKHDPLLCNICLESEIRVYKAVDILSKVIHSLSLDYDEFIEAVGKLVHYYENTAEIMQVDLEEIITLPPVLKDINSLWDDDDDE